MILQSTIPDDVSAADRLREYLSLVRSMSVQRDPQQMLNTYRERSRFVVNYDHSVSFSRRGVAGGTVKITRSTRWETIIDPWSQPEQLPLVDSPFVVRLMTAGHPTKMDDIDIDPDDPVAPYLDGMRSLATVPIFYLGEPVYMLMVARAHNPFSLDELATLTLTANLVGTATSQLILSRELEQAYAALDREVRLVGQIQRDLLPQSLPEIPGVKVAAHYETSARAGGDYYDFFPLGDDRWGIMIADVSGHGPSAAVVMAMMHAILHAPSRCGVGGAEPRDVLQLLNDRLIQSMRPGNFVTAFYGILDPTARTLRYAMAGHDPPRVLRGQTQTVEGMPSTDGLPLAILDEPSFSERTIELEPGDRVVLYTDGITETFGPHDELFGLARLDAAIRRRQCGAEGIIDAILADVREWGGGAPPKDDRTIVALALGECRQRS